MKRIIFKGLSLILLSLMLCAAFSSCSRKSKFSLENLENKQDTLNHNYSFDDGNDSQILQYNSEKLEDYIHYINGISVDYGYDELFDYQKAMEGIFVDHTVSEHRFCALDDNSTLTKEHLLVIVNKNTKEYLKDGTTDLVCAVDDEEFLLRICEIIVDVTNDMLDQYPEIDKERVYCNLGNLKIVEKKSALDFAAVEPDMVLHINRNTAQLAELLTDSSMYSVIIHETMHILQYGCACEPNKECVRRCGMAHSYNREQDYADWIWLAEGSAERMTCLYSDVEPMTYKNMVNYIVSMDLSTVLKDDVPANYLETLSFYGEPQKLFDLFGCENEKDKEEVYHLMYSLEIMQMLPDDVIRAFESKYGTELNDSVRDDMFNKIKRPIVMTITKNFYRNLANTALTSTVTQNDILFLINLYESTVNYHLRLDNSKYDEYNAEFVKWYSDIRERFFDCLTNTSADDYNQYSIEKSENKINAGMIWLEKEKQNFLLNKYEAIDNVYKFN